MLNRLSSTLRSQPIREEDLSVSTFGFHSTTTRTHPCDCLPIIGAERRLLPANGSQYSQPHHQIHQTRTVTATRLSNARRTRQRPPCRSPSTSSRFSTNRLIDRCRLLLDLGRRQQAHITFWYALTPFQTGISSHGQVPESEHSQQ